MSDLKTLTESEVLAMEAGLEMDGLIATEVCGWKRNPRFNDRWIDEDGFRRSFTPSTDIRDAYEAEEAVPEEEREHNGSILIEVMDDGRLWAIRHASPLDRSRALLLWAMRRAKA